jgi:hypothetical protein
MKTAALLSAVAVALSATVAHAAVTSIIVDPISASDNGHYSPAPGASATRTIDSTTTVGSDTFGLSDAGASIETGDPIPVSYPTTTASPLAASFYSNYGILTLGDDPSGPAIPEIIYTLDQAYTITGGHFWQYSGDREPSGGERSLTSADILVSSDGSLGSYVPAGILIPGYVEGAYGSTDAGVDFSLTGSFANVKFIKLTNLLAPGDNDIRVAFNEIRFFAAVTVVPEPASFGFVGLGGLALAALRRRAR